ncbi:uncharacterized protein LOC125502838 [Dendroctonus ponderosae]|uniref:uncharacterized protein LOC125502838 n=1 Tax=Dendroctonus ponderosae TaxID=77166 RepID=UPI0020359C0B|nr:uncharacterized protein LOC125502838 [Dendroctonus ponderosae]
MLTYNWDICKDINLSFEIAIENTFRISSNDVFDDKILLLRTWLNWKTQFFKDGTTCPNNSLQTFFMTLQDVSRDVIRARGGNLWHLLNRLKRETLEHGKGEENKPPELFDTVKCQKVQYFAHIMRNPNRYGLL